MIFKSPFSIKHPLWWTLPETPPLGIALHYPRATLNYPLGFGLRVLSVLWAREFANDHWKGSFTSVWLVLKGIEAIKIVEVREWFPWEDHMNSNQGFPPFPQIQLWTVERSLGALLTWGLSSTFIPGTQVEGLDRECKDYLISSNPYSPFPYFFHRRPITIWASGRAVQPQLY